MSLSRSAVRRLVVTYSQSCMPWMIPGTMACLAGCPAPDHPERPRIRPDSAAAVDVAAVCGQGGPFITEGRIPVPGTSDGTAAARIAGLRWQTHVDCERLVIDLVDEMEATVRHTGTVSADFLRELGIVRISLPHAVSVDPSATDARFDGALASAAFVVLARDQRGMWVDLHLAAPAGAHVLTVDDPARVVMDLKPAGSAVPVSAPHGNRVVILTPRAGLVSYPLMVSGYARTFEANVVVRLESGGIDVFEGFTTSTGYLETWGYFSMTIPEGPRGRVVLRVGEYSARDGDWEGVEIPLEMR